MNTTEKNVDGISGRCRVDLTSYLASKYFDQYNTVYNSSSHQYVDLTASYTFGFGKKIKRGNEVQTVTSSGSAIMK